MRQIIYILIVYSLISCSRLISSATQPIVDCVIAPFKAKELQTLQSNLVAYWSMNSKKWPNDKTMIMEFSDSLGLKLSPKFSSLNITNFGESVDARYQLIYEPSDTTEYKSILGTLNIRITNDTTMHLQYRIDRIEMRNGVICTDKSATNRQMKITQIK